MAAEMTQQEAEQADKAARVVFKPFYSYGAGYYITADGEWAETRIVVDGVQYYARLRPCDGYGTE